MIRHRLAVILLTIGTISGFASGFASLHCARHRRDAFEAHVARVCVDAARGAPPRGHLEEPPWGR